MTDRQREASLSAIIVGYNSASDLQRGLPALLAELQAGDEVIVVDNASGDATLEVAAAFGPRVRVLSNPTNTGFCAAGNRGAEAASGDLLLFLNPDAVVRPGFGAAIRAPHEEGLPWDAWMGLVTAGDGRTINTAGNIVHFTGIGWAGGSGRPLSEADQRRREVPFLSGACLVVRAGVWRRLGGFPPEFFMYQEDLDLSLRIRLTGGRIGIEPAARVDHAYEFAKGPAKWRALERNRWAVVVRTYPAPLLALVAPALIATEVALLPAAVVGGWGRQKIAAVAEGLRWLPRLLAERRVVQRSRTIPAAAFAAWLTADLSSPYLGRAGRSPLLRRLMRAYWHAVRSLLDLRRSGASAQAAGRYQST